MEDNLVFSFGELLADNISYLSTVLNDSDSEESQSPIPWKCLYLLNSSTEADNVLCNESDGIHGPGMEAQDHGSPWIRLLVLLLYGIVCIVGLCGNTLVIYVVVCFSKMQTVTNLYIVNLAIADECFLVGIPFLMSTTALQYWPFGDIMCKIYFTTTSINQVTSSMFLLIMSADRFLAVCHPISATKWRTPMIASTVAITAWALSAFIMVPIFMYANTREIHGTTNCNIFWPDGWIRGDTTFMMYSFILGFAIPLILISIFYFLVIIRLRHVGPKRHSLTQPTSSSNPTKSSPAVTPSAAAAVAAENEMHPTPLSANAKRARDRKKSKRKVTKLVLTVITVYFLCWAPYWISQLALISMEHETYHSPGLLTIFLLAGCLSYSNSAMNPILYAFLSDNFKKSFVKACSCANRKDANVALTLDNSMHPRNRGTRTSRASERRGTAESVSTNLLKERSNPPNRFLVSNANPYFNKPSIKISNDPPFDEEEGAFLEGDDDGTAILGHRRLSVQGPQTMTSRTAIPKIRIGVENPSGVHVTAL